MGRLIADSNALIGSASSVTSMQNYTIYAQMVVKPCIAALAIDVEALCAQDTVTSQDADSSSDVSVQTISTVEAIIIGLSVVCLVFLMLLLLYLYNRRRRRAADERLIQ